jgi:nitrogen fixation/metabolism regulation signal transduction histidine kinase
LTLIVIGAVTFVIAIGAALVLSRQLTSPLRDVAEAATAIAAGDWDRCAPVRGFAESVALATSFNEMTASMDSSCCAAFERCLARRLLSSPC